MSRIYDLVMTHLLDADDFFIHRVQQHCAEREMNFFLIEPLWVQSFLEQFDRGHVWAKVLLNMHSEHHLPEDVFHRLVWLAQARNTQVIDPPEIAQAAFDKARMHTQLLAGGVTVPPTIIVPRGEASDRRLTAEEEALLGRPFIIKPARGYGKRGVILDATDGTALRRSVAAWPDSHYLLQRRIVPRVLDGEPAYFRVYYVFSRVWCCWWNCYTDHYRMLSTEEEARHHLAPLRAIVARLASLSGMRFFSTEITLTESGEFVVIDYVNDQCYMLCQSVNPQIGVPDELVAAIARRLVEGAHALIR